MEVQVIAWQEIVDSRFKRVEDGIVLIALDTIRKGPIRLINKMTSEIEEEMYAEFKELFPNFYYGHIEIQLIENASNECGAIKKESSHI